MVDEMAMEITTEKLANCQERKKMRCLQPLVFRVIICMGFWTYGNMQHKSYVQRDHNAALMELKSEEARSS